MEFLEENALRLKDMFHQFDKDRSGDISRQEFKLGLKEMGILMDSVSLVIVCIRWSGLWRRQGFTILLKSTCQY